MQILLNFDFDYVTGAENSAGLIHLPFLNVMVAICTPSVEITTAPRFGSARFSLSFRGKATDRATGSPKDREGLPIRRRSCGAMRLLPAEVRGR